MKKTFFLVGMYFIVSLVITECTINTHHTIDPVVIKAHIIIDLREVKETASNIENFLSNDVKKQTKSDTFSVDELNDFLKSDNNSFLNIENLNKIVKNIFGVQSVYASNSIQHLTPKLKKILTNMKKRMPMLIKLRNAFYLGENNLGFVQIINTKLNKEVLAKIKQFADLENKDRKFLYTEIIKQNKLTAKDLEKIGSIFAVEKIRRLNKNNWFQVPQNKEALSEFLKTKVAKKYSKKELKPGNWIQFK